MTTKFNIEPALLDRADQASGERTKETVLTTAHEEFIAIRQQRRIAEHIGKFEWDASFDHKAGRSRK